MQRNDCVETSLVPSYANKAISKNGVLQDGASFVRSGDVQLSDGTVFGPDEYVRYQGSGVHHGQLTNEIGNSSNLNGASWTVRGDAVGPDGQTLSLGSSSSLSVFQVVFGLAINSPVSPQISVSNPNSETGTVSITNPAASSAGEWKIDMSQIGLSPTWISRDSQAITVVNEFSSTGAGSSGLFFFGPSPITIRVHCAELFESAYPIFPITIPTPTDSPTSIDTAASDATTLHGLTASFSDPDARWLWDLLDGPNTTGILTFKNLSIRPTLAQWNTTGGKLILMARQVDAVTVEPIFWLGQTDGKFYLTDGTNIAVSSAAYVAGTPTTVKINLEGTTMSIIQDGVEGAAVPFVGTLLHGTDTIKFFYLCEDLIEYEGIYPEPVNVWDYSIILLQYYQDNGATSNEINTAEYEFLVAQGATPASIPDMWFELLGTLGYTGSLSDRIKDFWCIGGGSLTP